ncbi:MAG: RNB domain-containing ribonuclease [Pseudomonadota bacterium]
MNQRKHDVVDYFDGRRIACGFVTDSSDDRHARVLNDKGQETTISVARILSSVPYSGFPTGQGKDEQVKTLKEIGRLRDEIKKTIDLHDLWEVLSNECETVDVDELTELFFGKELDQNSAASLLRAVNDDRTYFKIKPNEIEVQPADKVEQTLVQREREKAREDFLHRSAGFLARIKSSEEAVPGDAPDCLMSALEEAAVLGKDWHAQKLVKDAFALAGLGGEWDPFRVLVKLGVWSPDENVLMRAEKLPIGFSSDCTESAASVCSRIAPASAVDYTGLHMFAIDAETTRDVDDALSLSYDGEDALVGIHITNVAHFVDHGSDLDLEIRQRGTSIYLPDDMVPMIPPVLSEMGASLAVGEHRPAISAVVRFGPDLCMKDFEIVSSVIELKERLTYEQADERISASESTERRLHSIAQAWRSGRIASGAVIFRDPELTVRVVEEGRIEAALRDRETPSQILVSEMMILANNLFARFLKANGIPGIFRSQPAPSERVELADGYDPVQSYRAKRAMARGDIGVDPAPHFTLGLDCYATATSPLRRYPDLLVQRQIKSFLETGRPLLDRSEIEKVLVEISYPLERAVMLERDRHRYFLHKYLSQRKGQELEAIVLYRFPKFHLVQLTDFCLNGALNPNGATALNPYDRIMVRLQRVEPREDRLNLAFVRLL